MRVRWLRVGDGDTVHLSRWRAMLDDDERAQADRYRFASDRNVHIAAHALTRAMLSEATGLPTLTWLYAKAAFGKPRLASDFGDGGLRFNLSHTHGLVACAIARDEVGVDVEMADRRADYNIADRFFAPEEAQVVKSASPRDRADVFFRFWTLKEAFIKATGEGLRRPLDSFSFRLDPVRIAFHPEREETPSRDDPDAWQFAEYGPAPDRLLALAVRPAGGSPLQLDARAALPAEVAPR
jgi:4'-phosphopantetheinyl transferase